MHEGRVAKYGDPNHPVRVFMAKPDQCLAEGCTSPNPATQGLCAKHYGRLKRHGDPLWERPSCIMAGCSAIEFDGGLCRRHSNRALQLGDPEAACQFDSCSSVIDERSARGFCRLHYKRLMKYGDPRGVRLACGICEAEFFPVNSLRKVCDSCAESEVRQHHVDIQTIVDRDGSDCSLCDEPIDLDLRWPHPRSASVDHIKPWSLGGTHSLGNLALACLVCNMRKSNKYTAGAIAQ